VGAEAEFDEIPRILAVGELNPRGARPEMALYPLPRGASGDRFRRICGLHDADYLRHVARVNLCDLRWSLDVARLRAETILCESGPRVVVLLGARVRDAAEGPPFFMTRLWRHPSGLAERVIVTLPHPSGRCRLWNSEAEVERTRDLILRRVAPEIPWGSWKP